ncbi:MAG: preprotein translocase subunit Sec61beta [Candidatus Altiarchaeales archaeon]|nr:preprotein translocase subunit Sec61beta [Candidatus Altiarchaeales archaeon]
MKRKKSEGPMRGAGLIQYFDVDEGGFKIDPKAVIGVVVAFIILELLSHIVI